MANKFYNTRCVHCLKYFEVLTSDHVFPKSWYPKTTPNNLEKWQIPACDACNKKYGKIESELLLRIGLCTDPKEFKSLGISDRILRSVNPKLAKNKIDRLHRQKRQEKIFRELIPANTLPQQACLPGFGPQSGAKLDALKGVLIPADDLHLLGEKLVRGVTYLHYKRYIEHDHKVEIFFVHERNAQEIISKINQFGIKHHCGPGIRVGVAFAHDDPQSGLFDIEIWGKLRMYAAVKEN